MTVGERIQERRKQLGLSQGDVADHVGVTRGQVSAWENDHAFPQGGNLIPLAEILRVTTAWFQDDGGDLEDYAEDELPETHVVREPRGAYGDRRVVPVDLHGHPVMDDVELILSWVPEKMSARWTGEISLLDRLAQVYSYGSRAGWSADRLDFVHKTRQRLEAIQ